LTRFPFYKSLKVIEDYMIRLRTHEVILTFYSNYGSVLHPVPDTEFRNFVQSEETTMMWLPGVQEF